MSKSLISIAIYFIRHYALLIFSLTTIITIFNIYYYGCINIFKIRRNKEGQSSAMAMSNAYVLVTIKLCPPSTLPSHPIASQISTNLLLHYHTLFKCLFTALTPHDVFILIKLAAQFAWKKTGRAESVSKRPHKGNAC